MSPDAMFSLSSPPLPKRLSFPLPRFSCPTQRTHVRAMASTVTRRPRPAMAATMYELLSVPETAGPEEIKAAYRRQARLWHPDLCPSASEKGYFTEQFMRAREAYEILSDPELRQDYDFALRSGADVSPAAWASYALGGSAGGGRGAAAAAAREKAGFRENWSSQLDGLGRRADRSGHEETWGSRMRRARRYAPSD